MMHMSWFLAVAMVSVCGAQQQDDSLRNALEAVSRRRQDMSSGRPFFIAGQARPPPSQLEDSLPPYFESQEYGQPEDIGYGYQKSVAPHTAGIFEPIALPSAELGAHEALANNYLPPITAKDLERLTASADYIGAEPDNGRLLAHAHGRLSTSPAYKRSSVFRERGDPEALQLAAELEPNFARGPPTTPRIRSNALALVRNFGGLDRGDERETVDPSDPDAYLRLLNYVYQKYRTNDEEFDPEEIGDSDVEELIEYLGRGGGNENRDRKRSQHQGYDFFNNNPGAWYKRSEQRLDSPAQADGFFHALKFLSNGDRDVLEAIQNEEAPGEDKDEDVGRLLMQRGWQDVGGFDDRFPYKSVARRIPVTKRSLQSTTTATKNQALKGRTQPGATDPQVAQELDNIFSAAGEGDSYLKKKVIHDEENATATSTTTKPETKKKELFPEKKEKIDKSGGHSVHRRDKEVAGQKEETSMVEEEREEEEEKPVEVKKKSIDWSQYFGIDRRRKKSSDAAFDDEWLLNQYLQAYSHPKLLKASALREAEMEANNEIPYADDIDAKLRAMEDLIVEEALKYTGANQGQVEGQGQAHKVKQRVMSQLAAAYSLEKMRRALGEFKSSIAANNEESVGDVTSQPRHHHSTPAPLSSDSDKEEAAKRVAVKKEKADQGEKEKKFEKIFQEDIDKNYLPVEKTLHSVPVSRYYPQKGRLPLYESKRFNKRVPRYGGLPESADYASLWR